MKLILPALLALGSLMLALGQSKDSPLKALRPELRILNGSREPAEVFWLKNEKERVANSTVEPGKHRDITTTLGHRFVIVGSQSKAEATVTVRVPVQAFRFDPLDPAGVPSFYTQAISAEGYPITASASVSPYALKEAAYIVNLMLARRPDVREAMILSGARLCVIAHNEFTTGMPEWAWLADSPVEGFPGIATKDYRDARARGMGGSRTDPYCSCAEENVLDYPGNPASTECILIHEFAHNIHLRGMLNVDPTFDSRLQATYEAAMQTGLWKGKYASVNHHEYFAEGVQSWFGDNRENDHDHNHVNTRAELIAYDPGLASMCREVFRDTELNYTKPATRLTGHLAGYDPSKAPTFTWPAHLQTARQEILRQARERGQQASPKPETDAKNPGR